MTSLLTTRVEPAFDRTVHRDLVHRWSLSEVFLTSYDRIDDDRFVCGAQLPLTHAYFRDHPADRERYDPLNLLEACRQAVTCAAHEHQSLPRATTFMVRSWSLTLDDPAALTSGERPAGMRIDGRVTDRQARGGHVRRLVVDLTMSLDGRAAGSVSMNVSCAPTDQYHLLRRRQRGTEPPNAFTAPDLDTGTPVVAADVGRLDERNVVLDGAVVTGEGMTGWLSHRSLTNRSMYDHPYDHVPAMVLSEAARQCGRLLAPGAGWPVRLAGTFAAFAELDVATELVATRADATGAVVMTARQGGTTVAELDLTFDRPDRTEPS